MLKISWKWVGNTDRAGVWCEDRSTLITMICMLEDNVKVEQFKVEVAGAVIDNLYTQLGIGSVSKFVTSFTYKPEDH